MIVVVRAFTGDDGGHGNPVRVVFADGPVPDADARQRLASAGPEPATVFVAADRRTLRIHNRQSERRFIGHGVLGATAALRAVGEDPGSVLVPAGEVRVWRDGRTDWLHAPAAWSPAANARHRQAPAAEIDALTGPPPDEPVQVWGWLDEAAGTVRARQFKPSEGLVEDEACGSASMVLADALGRDLRVLHGRGSVILVRPRTGGVDLGGRCVVDPGISDAGPRR